MPTPDIARCTDDGEWDRFVASSPQGSVFTSSAFLQSLGEECERWLVRENGVPVLAAPILVRDGQTLPQPYAFTQYIGPMFSGAFEQQPSHRRVPLHLRLLEFLLLELVARYPAFSFSLHPALNDVRAFQWLHYHTPELGRMAINPVYTGRLALDATAELSAYLEKVRTVRRQEFRKVEGLGYTRQDGDYATLDRLHELTFARQGLARSEREVRLLRSITNTALERGFGHCHIARSPAGETASAVFFIHDQDAAYYLFGANDPELRKTGAGSWLLIQAIEQARQAGRRFIDFVGVNSPNRGDFKTSFNAEPVVYFNVAWKRPIASA